MKKIVFAFSIVLLFVNSSNTLARNGNAKGNFQQPTHSNPNVLKVRCIKGRAYFGPAGETPTVVEFMICCFFQWTASPPVICGIAANKDGNTTAYIRLCDLEGEIKSRLQKNGIPASLNISRCETIDIDGKPYRVKQNNYEVINDKQEGPYLAVILEPVN